MGRSWITGMAVMAVAAPTLLSCTLPAGQQSGGSTPTPQTQTTPRTVIGCTTARIGGGECVTLQQHGMQPAQTDQGYATEISWTLTNQCPGTMSVTWNWGGPEAGRTLLAQGQSTDLSCLMNIDGCTGNVQYEYRCAEVSRP